MQQANYVMIYTASSKGIHVFPHIPIVMSASSSLSFCSLSGLLSLFLGYLLAARDGSLGADAAEHEADAEDLHVRQAVAEGNDGEHHSEHLAGDRDGHEEDGGKRR